MTHLFYKWSEKIMFIWFTAWISVYSYLIKAVVRFVCPSFPLFQGKPFHSLVIRSIGCWHLRWILLRHYLGQRDLLSLRLILSWFPVTSKGPDSSRKLPLGENKVSFRLQCTLSKPRMQTPNRKVVLPYPAFHLLTADTPKRRPQNAEFLSEILQLRIYSSGKTSQ